MKKVFEKFNLQLDEQKVDKFNRYYELLVEYNERFNLTAIVNKDEVIVKHFVDSLLGAKYFTKGKLIDIGSGAGFPAIPLKIFNDDLDVTLVEATGKKCTFLNAVIKELGLKNIKVVNDRAEILGKNPDFREKFDFCSARAVARLNTLAEYCMPFVKVDGYFIPYKGDVTEELEDGKRAVKLLGGKIEKVDEFLLEDAKRSIVLVKKVSNTQNIYPRGNGKERKKPL
ncbi:MAG: 16S rRNA (guanine(527)-N(7))-methyltransferase RsmG [Clostridia bacterium]|nr:16S rRNA (guanine(527)-N(7))-methyltransferase RsmG [Clostridia bacterium]